MEDELPSLLGRLLVEDGLADAVLSNPRHRAELVRRVTVKPVVLRGALRFQLTSHLRDRATDENLAPAEAARQLEELLRKGYRQGLLRSPETEHQVLVSRNGEVKILSRARAAAAPPADLAHDRRKRRLLEEGRPNPLLVELGVMNARGKVRAQRYGKFRQLNRFLELVDDVVGELPHGRPVRIVEAGSGKAYLTFALYQHLRDARGFELDVLGLDLKADVVADCNALVARLGYERLRFEVGDVAGYELEGEADLVISLHACDTATDAAIERAIRWQAKVILAVPCCQHELMPQLRSEQLDALLEHGIVRERLAALVTDSLRAKLLELAGYRTQILEFVDLEHTAKNLLIRAVRRPGRDRERLAREYVALRDALGVDPFLERALEDVVEPVLAQYGLTAPAKRSA